MSIEARRLAFMVMTTAVLAPDARADGLDAERFAPAVGTEASFSFEHPAVPFHLGWGLGLFLDGADDAVVERDAGDDVVSRPLDTAMSADLLATIGLFGWSELGVHLPVQLVYSGDDYADGGTMLSASGGIGDLRLVPKVALLRKGSRERHGLIGVALPVTLPTGSEEALRGAGGVTVEPRLMAAVHVGALGLGGSAGYRWRSQHPAGLPYADEVVLGLMAAYSITPALALRGEAFGGKQVGGDVEGADFPFELLGGLTYRIADAWDLHGGATLGLTDGIGDPDFRLIAGVRFRHRAPERQGFADSDGDGILDKDDDCPDQAEDTDGFKDDDGCPEPDNDHDGILDDDDECPDMPEDPGGDRDGCPDRPQVKYVDGKLVVFGKVQFKTGSAEIDKKSDPLLDQLAAVMEANPGIKKVRIEGHTDNVGGRDINQRLSEDRARSVRDALAARGVSGDRLDTAGHGESRPTAPNTSRAGRAKNRRVEFIIADQEGK